MHGDILDGAAFVGDRKLDQEMRWITTIVYNNTVVYFRIDMINLTLHDNTPNITTHILDIINGRDPDSRLTSLRRHKLVISGQNWSYVV